MSVPSNVDVAALKAEFLYQYQKENGVSFRTRLFADNVKYNKLGSLMPSVTNFVLSTNASETIHGDRGREKYPKISADHN